VIFEAMIEPVLAAYFSDQQTVDQDGKASNCNLASRA
jgi:hypothetical protein